MASKKKGIQPVRPSESTPPTTTPETPEQAKTRIFGDLSQQDTTTQKQDFEFSPPPPRWAIIETKDKTGKTITQRAYGPHRGVVDASGRLLPYYDPYVDPERLYYKLGPQRLGQLVTDLQSVGYNISSQPSLVNALTNLIRQSNIVGYTWDMTLQMMKNNMPFKIGGGGGGGARVSNADDLKAIARQVARQVIGREFTAAESDAFVAAYQGLQRSQGGGAPSADVYAEKFAQEKAPQEATAYKYLDYVNQLISAVGGGNV